MDAASEAAELEPTLRAELEGVLLRLAKAGHIPDRGEREIVIRIKPDHHVSWFEPRRVRVPASELGAGFDETAGG